MSDNSWPEESRRTGREQTARLDRFFSLSLRCGCWQTARQAVAECSHCQSMVVYNALAVSVGQQLLTSLTTTPSQTSVLQQPHDWSCLSVTFVMYTMALCSISTAFNTLTNFSNFTAYIFLLPSTMCYFCCNPSVLINCNQCVTL